MSYYFFTWKLSVFNWKKCQFSIGIYILIILALLMTVSVFAGKKRVTNSTGLDNNKSRSCSQAKNECGYYPNKGDNETLVGMSSCSCSKKGYWTCNVTCTYERDDE